MHWIRTTATVFVVAGTISGLTVHASEAVSAENASQPNIDQSAAFHLFFRQLNAAALAAQRETSAPNAVARQHQRAYQHSLGVSDEEYAILTRRSEACEVELAIHERQALAKISELRSQRLKLGALGTSVLIQRSGSVR
jgi:hypothetical protein